MFGLSLSNVKWIAAGIATIVLLSIVFAGYRFVENQIQDRVNAAVSAVQEQDAARVTAATLAQTEAEARANAAQEAATLKRLSDLSTDHSTNAKAIDTLSGRLTHDIGTLAPPAASAAANVDFGRIGCVLERSSGSDRGCDGAAAPAAEPADPGRAASGKSSRNYVESPSRSADTRAGLWLERAGVPRSRREPYHSRRLDG